MPAARTTRRAAPATVLTVASLDPVDLHARSDIGEPTNLARAVADRLGVNSHVLENRHMEVRERRALREANVATAFDPRGLAANERDREIVVEVRVAVADARSIEKQAVVQHGAVALG